MDTNKKMMIIGTLLRIDPFKKIYIFRELNKETIGFISMYSTEYIVNNNIIYKIEQKKELEGPLNDQNTPLSIVKRGSNTLTLLNGGKGFIEAIKRSMINAWGVGWAMDKLKELYPNEYNVLYPIVNAHIQMYNKKNEIRPEYKNMPALMPPNIFKEENVIKKKFEELKQENKNIENINSNISLDEKGRVLPIKRSFLKRIIIKIKNYFRRFYLEIYKVIY